MIQPVTGMNSTRPNQKIVEVKGWYSTKKKHFDGRKVVLASRENSNKKIRSKDQYWECEQVYGGKFVIKNKFFNSYIAVDTKGVLRLKKSIDDAVKWEVE